MAVKRLLLALGFLTRLPVPRVEASQEDFARAVRVYPLAGVAIGLVVAGAGWVGSLADAWVGALAALLGWVWITGALHLDGLGDLADGLGAAHGDRSRMLVAMADPHIGSFGVVAIALQLAAKLVLLHLLLPDYWPAIIATPFAARIGPLVWARWLVPLRPGGLGATIVDAVRLRDVVGWTAALAAASALLPPLLAVPVAVAVLGIWFDRRVGGVTGDVHGAGIELTETAALLAFVIYSAV